MKNYGKGHNKDLLKKALRKESRNGSRIRSRSLRIISPIPPWSETLWGSQKKPPKAVLEVKCAREACQEEYHLDRGKENCQKSSHVEMHS